MRVALDVSAVPMNIAGAGRYVVELARRLPEYDVSTTLVTRTSDGARWTSLVDGASRVDPVVPDGRVARLAYEALLLGHSTSARNADVWHAPHYTMPHRRLRPTVVTIHDLTFFTNPEWHERAKVVFFQRAIRYAATHADALVCVSDFTARLLHDVVTTSVPVFVAPHGVDLQRFTPVGDGDDVHLAALGLAGDQRAILFVGTIEPRKGLDVLLRAFASLGPAYDDVQLWIVGQRGWGEAWDDDVLDAPTARRVHRLGYVDDAALPALLRRATVVAYPSRGEGFGLPVVEALACGASVVTSAATVMAEVAGDAATLTPVGDPAALAAALTSLLDQTPDERRDRARHARRRAEHFTWDASLRQHRLAFEAASS